MGTVSIALAGVVSPNLPGLNVGPAIRIITYKLHPSRMSSV